MEEMHLFRKEMGCRDIFLRSQGNHGRNDKSKQTGLHCSGDWFEGAILQHSREDEICPLNCVTQLLGYENYKIARAGI
jgi:hypothetical protein